MNKKTSAYTVGRLTRSDFRKWVKQEIFARDFEIVIHETKNFLDSSFIFKGKEDDIKEINEIINRKIKEIS